MTGVAVFSGTRSMTTVALLAAVGISLFVLESFIPMPLPFLKIGFANISSVVALVLLGPGPMYLVVMIRIVAGSLLVGSFLGPSFLLAIAGGMASATAMALVFRAAPRLFSPVGLSLIGSTVHVAVQLVIVVLLYVRNDSLIILLPLLLFSSLLGGTIVGWMSLRVLAVLKTIRTG